MDESKLPMDKRGKIEKDVQIMIKLLPNQIELETKATAVDTQKLKTIETKLNEAVTFDYNDDEGRFAKATRNMRVGDTVLTETALCATLTERFSKSHCQHCFTR